MQVKCSCGKLLNVPDTQAGKNARCPACRKVFKVPDAAAAAAPPTKIPFRCSCGKILSAPLSAAGKKVLCPKCNSEITVPPAPAPVAPPAPPAAAKAPAAAKPAAPKPAAPPKAAPAGEHFGLDLEELIAPPAPPKPPPESKPAEAIEYSIGSAKCPNCKADLDPSAQFCIACGTSLATGRKVEAAKVVVAEKKGFLGSMSAEAKHKATMAIALIVVILAVGYYVWWMMFKPRGSVPYHPLPPARQGPRR